MSITNFVESIFLSLTLNVLYIYAFVYLELIHSMYIAKNSYLIHSTRVIVGIRWKTII